MKTHACLLSPLLKVVCFAFVFLQGLLLKLSLVMRKPVSGFATRYDSNRPAQLQRLVKSLEISAIASRSIKLSRQRTTKALFRRRGCAG